MMAAAAAWRGFFYFHLGGSSRRVHFIPTLHRFSLILPTTGSNFQSLIGYHHHHHSRGRPLLFSPFLSSSSSFSSSISCTQETLKGTQQVEKEASYNVMNILEERGLVESLTSDKLKVHCSDRNLPPLRVYCGFDPTAQSLHVGNLLGIIVLSWFLRCGHKAVALVGGATGRVGDPSGKSLERPELDLHTLEANTTAIVHTLHRILSTNSSDAFVVLNNYDWWKDIKLLDFLKQVGRFARVGTMLSKDSVRRRLEDSEQGMSYTEFTYQLLQGYDFVHLFQNENVNVQIGGSDQWGNITAGIDLIRRIIITPAATPTDAYGLTFPLLLKSDGTKFGKSEEGAIWLSPSMLSPYKFYQHFFTVPDTNVITFLKRLTFLNMEKIAEIERKMLQAPDYVPNTAQRILAEEVTRFVHGQQGLDEALKATEALKPGGADSLKLDWETIQGISQDVPSCLLPYTQVLNVSVIDLSVSSGLLETKSAARRLLKQGGLYLNNTRVDNETKKIKTEDIIQGKILLLSAAAKSSLLATCLEFRRVNCFAPWAKNLITPHHKKNR